MKEQRKAEEKLDLRNRLEKGEWIVNTVALLAKSRVQYVQLVTILQKLKKMLVGNWNGCQKFTNDLRLNEFEIVEWG